MSTHQNQTTNPNELGLLTAVPEDWQVVGASPDGPLQRLPYDLLLAKLVKADLVIDNSTILAPNLDHPAGAVALVHDDPDPLKNGWWRKTGAPGSGGWVIFEILSMSVRDEIEAILEQVNAAAADAALSLTNIGTAGAQIIADATAAGAAQVALAAEQVALAEEVLEATEQAGAQIISDATAAGADKVALAAAEADRAEEAAAALVSTGISLVTDNFIEQGTIGTTITPVVETGAAASSTFALEDEFPAQALLRTLRIYARATGTLKIKRITRSGGSDTIIQVYSIAISATGLQTIDLSALDIVCGPGEWLAFYGPSILAFTSGSPTPVTPYRVLAGDASGTVATGALTTTVRLEVAVDYLVMGIDVQDEALQRSLDTGDRIGRQAAVGEVVYYGGNDELTDPGIDMNNFLSIDARPAQHGGVIDEVAVWGRRNGSVLMVLAKRASGGQLVIYREVRLTIVAGQVNTFTVANGLPGDFYILPDSFIGWYCDVGAIGYASASNRQLPFTYAFALGQYPSGPFTPILSPSNYQIAHRVKIIRAVSRAQTPTRRARKMLVEETFSDARQPYLLNKTGTWTFGSGTATSSTPGVNNTLAGRVSEGFHHSFCRFDFSLDSADAAAYCGKLPWFTGAFGSMVKLDLAANTLVIYSDWSTSTVDSTNVLPFTLVQGRIYRVEMVRVGRVLTFSIIDMVTSAKWQKTFDYSAAGVISYAGGLMTGKAAVAVASGTVNFRRIEHGTQIKSPRVIISGDSYSLGFNQPYANAWTAQLNAAMGTQVLIDGIGGSTALMALRRMKYLIDYYQPEFWIFALGTNADAATQSLTSVEATQEYYDIAESICRRAGIVPIIQCTAPTTSSHPVDLSAYVLSKGWRTVRFDLALSLNNDGVTRDPANFDGTNHPTVAAHAKMYERLKLDVPELFE